MLNFIASPAGALLGKIMMALTLATMIYVAVSNYNEGIRATERAANRNAQLEEVIKNQAVIYGKMRKIETLNEQILAERDGKNAQVAQRHTEVNNYIQSPEAQKSNRATSDVIRNTVGMLRNEK